jgi:stage III sporulation protein SpoIIIAA
VGQLGTRETGLISTTQAGKTPTAKAAAMPVCHGLHLVTENKKVILDTRQKESVMELGSVQIGTRVRVGVLDG